MAAGIRSEYFHKLIKDKMEEWASKLRTIEEAGRIGVRRPLDITVNVVTNRDQSVDAELLVRVIPRGVRVEDVVTAIERYAEPIEDTFVTNGIIYPVKGDDPIYIFNAGMSQAETYYQKSSELPENFGTVREIIHNMEKAGRRKAERLFIRYHWNPEDKNPKSNPFGRHTREKKKKGGK